jgi:predicted ATPase
MTPTYAVIVGEHGTGKSTAVRKAARDNGRNNADGVVYIEIGDARMFSIASTALYPRSTG